MAQVMELRLYVLMTPCLAGNKTDETDGTNAKSRLKLISVGDFLDFVGVGVMRVAERKEEKGVVSSPLPSSPACSAPISSPAELLAL